MLKGAGLRSCWQRTGATSTIGLALLPEQRAVDDVVPAAGGDVQLGSGINLEGLTQGSWLMTNGTRSMAWEDRRLFVGPENASAVHGLCSTT